MNNFSFSFSNPSSERSLKVIVVLVIMHINEIKIFSLILKLKKDRKI
jgi:hypothetical protein